MKKTRIGIIGAGKIAQRLHLPLYKGIKTAEVKAICDVKKNKAAVLAEKFKIKNIYSDYKKMIKNAGIDAVSVCAPNYLHAPMTIFAAENKKHVLCEKPMALTMNEMKQMIRACEKNRVKLMVEQAQRFDPAHEAFKNFIKSGRLGKIVSIRAKLGHSGPEFWSNDSPWFFDRAKSGGGVTMDVGIHIVDLVRFVTGKEVKEAGALMDNLVKKKMKLEDNVEIAARFKDGSLGVIEASWTNSPYEVVVQVYGEKGKAIVTRPERGNSGISAWTVNPAKPYTTVKKIRVKVPKKPSYGNPCSHFIDVIRKNKKCISGGREGMKSMAVILAAIKSAKTKKIERVQYK